jgi:Na+(H+)/acetate symporter ActP
VVSAGVTIGLGMYFAWVHRDWSASTRSTGFAVAVAGGLIGAWLGFNAEGGLIAPVTAILGAAAGGNLTLLVLDIWWDRLHRDRFVQAGANPTPEALTPAPTSAAGAA